MQTREQDTPIQTYCRLVDHGVLAYVFVSEAPDSFAHPRRMGNRSPSTHARRGRPDSFSDERVRAFAAGSPFAHINTTGGRCSTVSSHRRGSG